MAKSENIFFDVFKIFFKSLKIYVINLPKFLAYMSFPVFGIFGGCALILGLTYAFTELAVKYSWTEYLNNLFLCLVIFALILLPGFLIFCKAFLDYLIAMITLSKAGFDMVATDILPKDLKSYHSIFEGRERSLILVFTILFCIYLPLSIPFLLPIALVFFLYSCLTLQGFASDNKLGAFASIRRSFLLISGHVPSTTLLLLLIGISTYSLIPEGFWWLLSAGKITQYLYIPSQAVIGKMPILETVVPHINSIFQEFHLPIIVTVKMIVELFTKSIVVSMMIAFLLPVRSIAFALWFKRLNDGACAGANTAKKMVKKAKEEV